MCSYRWLGVCVGGWLGTCVWELVEHVYVTVCRRRVG